MTNEEFEREENERERIALTTRVGILTDRVDALCHRVEELENERTQHFQQMKIIEIALESYVKQTDDRISRLEKIIERHMEPETTE